MVSDRKILWLMRHGALSDEYHGRLVGSLDLPLSEQGRHDARAAAGFISRQGPFGLIMASPKLRARQTTELALPAELQESVEYDPLLRETDFGAWEGLSIAEIAERYPEQYGFWSAENLDFAFPGGESMGSFVDRLTVLKEKIVAAEADKILMIAHGGIILGLLCAFLDLPRRKMVAFKLDRGALCRIDIFPGGLGALAVFNLKPGDFNREVN